MVKMLDETFGLKRAMMTTVHAYTADQPLADVAGADLRRSRSAVENIIPNTTQSPDLIKKLCLNIKERLKALLLMCQFQMDHVLINNRIDLCHN